MIEVTGPPLDLNYKDDKMCSNTALHMSSANGHYEVVKLLLK
jgi:ankyrin repeat protein